MEGWSLQATVGVLGGALVFAAVLVPIIAVQSRRYGRVSVLRLLGAAAVSVYAVALAAYTSLPLPVSIATCAPVEWVPGHSFGDIVRETEGLGPVGTLTSRATMQVVLNVALFVPLGIVVRRYWHRGVLAAVLAGAAGSLVIEATQGTGIWGLYECAYRVADVDDLLANTLGALIGAVIAPALLWWMPRAGELARGRRRPRPVTAGRRWLGMLLDLAAFSACTAVVAVVVRLVRYLAVGERALAEQPPALEQALASAVAGVAVVVVPALIGSGASLGQRIVWLEPRRIDAAGRAGPVAPARRLVRAMAVGGPFALAAALQPAAAAVPELGVASAIVGLLSALVVALSVLSVPTTRGSRGLSAVVAGIEMADARAPRDDERADAPSPGASAR